MLLLNGLFTVAATIFAAGLLAAPALSEETDKREWHHALSLVGEPQYGPDLAHFKWVNPDAPKGGSARMHSIGTFDSLNQFPIKGNPAIGLNLIYDSLMDRSLDEASTVYAHVAEAVTYPKDYSSVTFRLNPAARFHDGEPIDPEDVIFSLTALKDVNPGLAFYYKNISRAEQTGEREVTFYFDVKNNRELPHIAAELPVLPKHYWSGTDAHGNDRDLARSSLEKPLASGPYRVKSFEAGRSITYERVEDYWARDLPTMSGRWNLDEISFEYFRDSTVAFEAFKAGKIDYYRENSSKNWATGYEFPAAGKGYVKREQLPIDRVSAMQAFVFNTRRSKLQDPRVRRAFNLAFNFEWSNKNLFYGLYERVDSYFDNSELEAVGVPEGLELEILEPLRDQVPPEVFTQDYENPVNASTRDFRTHLREAARLLGEAGWQIEGGRRVHTETGDVLQVEFLLVSPSFERVVLPYAQNLKRLGIAVNVRVVDTSQYRRRLDSFDFDIVVGRFAQSESPGNEQRDFWGSEAASKQGSRNLIGITNPAVDTLVDRIIFAKDRAELVAATRALDRVLLWNHYLVPQWHNPEAWVAYWDKYAHPDRMPSRDVGFLEVWWYMPEKAARLAKAGQ